MRACMYVCKQKTWVDDSRRCKEITYLLRLTCVLSGALLYFTFFLFFFLLSPQLHSTKQSHSSSKMQNTNISIPPNPHPHIVMH